MRMQNAKCPNCGACLMVDMVVGKGHCLYCGGEMIYEDAVERVKIDGIADFDSLMLSAQNELDFGEDFDSARDYYKKALRVRPNDYRASWGIFLCEMNSILWHYGRKGFVQIPGDTRDCIADNIERYGRRAYNFAPEETQEYYQSVFDHYLSQRY